MSYITAMIKADQVYHGYDEDLNVVKADVGSTEFVEKVIKLDRILSFTESYIFIICPHETVQTWEYQGGIESIKSKLRKANLLVD